MDQVQCLDKLDLERTLAAFRLANTTPSWSRRNQQYPLKDQRDPRTLSLSAVRSWSYGHAVIALPAAA